jgi:hypothetical protein
MPASRRAWVRAAAVFGRAKGPPDLLLAALTREADRGDNQNPISEMVLM